VLPPGSALVILSRSGESAEILKLLANARESNAIVVGLTHSEGSSLARQAQIPLVIPVQLDHSISVNTYTCLAASATILASTVVDRFRSATRDELLRAIEAMSERISVWQRQIACTNWLSRDSAYYFLARGSSLATATKLACCGRREPSIRLPPWEQRAFAMARRKSSLLVCGLACG
jgi:glucosamine--fructose-6-phosphate aminotransferase (isomerizing)